MQRDRGRAAGVGHPARGREAPPLVRCFWCERLHPAEHPLAVCPACRARFSTLRSLEMSGSYPLSNAAIDGALTRAPWALRASALVPPGLGVPALGRVGDAETSYTHFGYSFAASAEAAFEKECRNYDDFKGSGELDNESPPDRAAQVPAP